MCSAWFAAATKCKRRVISFSLVVMVSFIVGSMPYIDADQLRRFFLLITVLFVCLTLVYCAQRRRQLKLMKKSGGYHQRKRLEQKLKTVLRDDAFYSVRNPENGEKMFAVKESGFLGIVTYYVWFESETLNHMDDDTMCNVYLCRTETYTICSDVETIELDVEIGWRVGPVRSSNPDGSWRLEKSGGELVGAFERMCDAIDRWVPSSVS